MKLLFIFSGILACSAGNHYGFRPIMLVGAVVVVLCLGSGYVLTDIVYFFVIVGIIGGQLSIT